MTRRLIAALVLSLLAAPLSTARAAETAKPNILFIAIDDMNAWVEKTDPTKPKVICPNLDRLAARGVTFQKGYCAAPVCNPSRAALMSGLRPGQSSCYDNNTDWRRVINHDPPTLNEWFRTKGYAVLAGGKIYHGSFPRFEDWDFYLKEPSNEPKPPKDKPDGVGGIKFAPLPDAKDEDMIDYKNVTWACNEMQKAHDKPLFLAIGLHRPHMPWNVPQKYYDMYPLDSFELPKVLDHDLDDLPRAGVKMAKPEGDHAAMLKSGRWKEAVQGYLAANTFADAQIGRLIDALDKSPISKNTIICLWGDHGWHLGEKEHWRKFALWEEATRAPFIWVVPGMTKAGGICTRTVDFMSIYPTLCDLAGIDKPGHVSDPTLRPLLENPAATWDRPGITTHGFQNHAVRTERYRYIRYADGGEELYDEQADPLEWTNLANKPELASVKADLAKWLPTINNKTPKDAITRGGGEGADEDKPTKKARNAKKAEKKNKAEK